MVDTIPTTEPKAKPTVSLLTLAGQVKELLKGKKTYCILAVAIILATLQGKGFIIVPEYVWTIIKAVVGVTVAAKVNRLSEAVKSQT